MSGSLFQELKRRNVFRVAAIYVVVSWLLIQIGDTIFPALLLPEWTTTMLVAFLMLGLPVALIFAWAYEVTPEGVLRTDEVPTDQSITTDTGQKINRMIITVLAAAVVVLLVKIFLETPDAAPLPAPDPQASGQSIAVLPFKNQSAAAENAEFFAGGLHDELLTLLSKIGGLKVISRTSVERLDDDLSIPEIGALLGVATILEGQVQRAGDRLRINVQLIDTRGEDHLWANTYDRELTAKNIFDVQSDIARTISGALHAELSIDEEELLQAVPTANIAALESYLLGKQSWERGTFEALRLAEKHLEKATTLDPDFAGAWAVYAGIKTELADLGAASLDEYLTDAEPAVKRALELDGSLSEAHAELGNLLWKSGDFDAAEVAYARALQLNPNLPYSLLAYGTYLRSTNRSADAIPILERALAVDPLSLMIMFDLGKSSMYLGRPDETQAYAERMLKMDPTSVFGYAARVQGYSVTGQLDAAMRWLIPLLEVDPQDYEGWAYMALWSDLMGIPELAKKYRGRADELGPNEPVVLKCNLQALSMNGDHAEATRIANRAIDAGLDDRWYSNRVFLRQIRDSATTDEALQSSVELYKNRHPELFEEKPRITVTNINAAADLAFLLRRLQRSDEAQLLASAAMKWHEITRPRNVYGYEIGIVIVDLLTFDGDTEAAVQTLQEAVASGWNYSWPWYIDSPNFDEIRDRPEFQVVVATLKEQMITQREAYLALPDMGEFDLRN